MFDRLCGVVDVPFGVSSGVYRGKEKENEQQYIYMCMCVFKIIIIFKKNEVLVKYML